MITKREYRILCDDWTIKNTLWLAERNGDTRLVEWCKRELEKRKNIK